MMTRQIYFEVIWFRYSYLLGQDLMIKMELSDFSVFDTLPDAINWL